MLEQLEITMSDHGILDETRNLLRVFREIDPQTLIATFTIEFPPDNPPDVYFDTNVWISMGRDDVEALREIRRQRGFRYRYSVTNYVELLSRLGRGPAPGWANPFQIVRASFRRIRQLCDPLVLPSPEMEYLEEVQLLHHIDPVWVPDPQQTAIAMDVICEAETLGDVTGEGVQSASSLRVPRWVVDPNHYLRLTQTDETSVTHLLEELNDTVRGRLRRDNLDPLVQWFLKLATFFLLFRPSQRRVTLNHLSPEERDRFVAGFTRGAGRMFQSHITLMATRTIDLGEHLDPNDLYDAMQLLTLRNNSRLFVTNERNFFRYLNNPDIHRVVPWNAFRPKASLVGRRWSQGAGSLY